MSDLVLIGRWVINAPKAELFGLLTDFDNYPILFPKVAESVVTEDIIGDVYKIKARLKSFGRTFDVIMNAQLFPDDRFISKNRSSFGTSGQEEMRFIETEEGTILHYKYELTIHKWWLKIVAVPVIKIFAMKFWEKAVIVRLRELCEC